MTAIGTVTTYNGDRTSEIVLLAARNSENGKPSSTGIGLSVQKLINLYNKAPDVVTLRLYSTAISGAGQATARLWGHSPTSGWAPVGFGPDNAKGTLNNGQAIGESDTDKIQHAEPIALPTHFDELYLEITAIANATVEATLVITR